MSYEKKNNSLTLKLHFGSQINPDVLKITSRHQSIICFEKKTKY